MGHTLDIAHLTAETGFSGGETQLFLLMEGLRRRGHRNLLLCPQDSEAAREAGRRGLACRSVRTGSEWSPRDVFSVRRALRRAHPDLVHLHSGRATWLGGIAAAGLGSIALSTRRMDRPMRRGLRTDWVYGRALRRTVAISRAVERRLLDAGVPPERILVIPSAVDPERLRPRREPAALRQELGASPSEVCLLVVAALVERKGIDVLIDALARLAGEGLAPTLWIAGTGPLLGALEGRARGRGVAEQVRFLGQRADVPELCAACDVLVLPSHLEGLGVAALEAMALGRPVLASRVGGLAEAVVHERTGLLIPPGDPAALAEALARLLTDGSLRRRLGAAGPAWIAERYHADAMVSAYEALYFELLAADRGPP